MLGMPEREIGHRDRQDLADLIEQILGCRLRGSCCGGVGLDKDAEHPRQALQPLLLADHRRAQPLGASPVDVTRTLVTSSAMNSAGP